MSVKIASLPNLRDFSGYVNKDGFSIKPNKIIRSDVLFVISEDDFKELYNAVFSGGGVVIDLRNEGEISKRPDKFINEYSNIAYHNFCLLDVEFFKQIGLYESVDTFIGRYNMADFEKVMSEMYKQFITNPKSVEAFKNIFDVIKENPNAGILYHCITGRDRTGILTALIMLMLDFSESDIIEEYLLTNKLRAEYNRQRLENAKKDGKSDEFVEKLAKFSIITKENMQIFLNQIKKSFGSYENFYEHIGMKKSDIANLKSNFLQKSKVKVL